MNDTTLTSLKSYIVTIVLPNVDDAAKFETEAIDAILALDEKWEAENNSNFKVEVFADRSFSDEFTRAIVTDIPLVPGVFLIMSIFACFVFFRRDWVFSRTLLGFGAVISVLLSIMCGYGLLFIIGVPFTSMTKILPFIMFGIGLDDAFILSGAYRRTDKNKDPVDRIHDTIEEVGVSIFVTTVTSVVAFGLGCTSSIPAIYWLCLYAFPTIFLDFWFQITFFVALIVIDERRVLENRRDCLVCCLAKNRNNEDKEPKEDTNVIDKFMGVYTDMLMNTWIKVGVIVGFLALLGGCAYSASQLEQAFSFVDVLPKDSYVTDYVYASQDFLQTNGVNPLAFFRYVDQGDEAIQQQTEDYVNELVDVSYFTGQPVFFWLRDFKNFTAGDGSLQTLPFNKQMDALLANAVYHELYNDHIVRDKNNGDVVSSRVFMRMGNVDQENVKESIAALEAQRSVSAAQPVNQGRDDDWAFFTYDSAYLIWEFYSVAQYELTLTTILGVVAVTIIGTIFIPHWSACFFVLPLISILYVDLLGVLQFGGVSINAVSYISLVMSIGLLVDFLMHILLRFYESTERTREAKVKDMMTGMGSSILVGGISTFLGVIPLAFSTSEIFSTIFITFMGLVSLGIGHGLIFVPVVLSIIGPTEVIPIAKQHSPEALPTAGKVLEHEAEEALPTAGKVLEHGDTSSVSSLDVSVMASAVA